MFRDSQNNISEVREFNNFYKIKHHRALKDISEALEQHCLAQKI